MTALREREGERERERDAQIYIHTDRESEGERHRETDRQTYRQTDRQRERETASQAEKLSPSLSISLAHTHIHKRKELLPWCRYWRFPRTGCPNQVTYVVSVWVSLHNNLCDFISEHL